MKHDALPFFSIFACLPMAILASACAYAPRRAPVHAALTSAAAPIVEQAPSACADTSDGLCTPGEDFAARMCSGFYPDVALSLFRRDEPWTRAYLRQGDEEVLVLARGVTYDVLRWDGTCVSLVPSDVTFKKPPQPKAAPIPWRRLSEPTRAALLASPKVQATHKLVHTACDDANDASGNAGAKSDPKSCDRADAAFDRAIVEYVRAGGALPEPAQRP